MSSERDYFVYLMASQSRTLYIGMTNNIRRRVQQHRDGTVAGFTSTYKISRLVHVERYGDVNGAIAREKQVKRWRRDKKIALIQGENPNWDDLTEFVW